MTGIIVHNEDKELAVKLQKEYLQFFLEKKIKIVSISEIKKADFVVVIGGDGTLLRASKKIIKNNNIVVFAVNAGSLGFLTEIKMEEFKSTFENYLVGKIKIEERYFLEINYGEEKIKALNEVVISKEGAIAKIIDIELKNETTKICNYKGDGLIVATPTGSTAYSLSAGGPIVVPGLKVVVVTPLAPHNLATRPILLNGEENIILSLKKEQRAYMIVDGEVEREISDRDKILIKLSDKKLRLVLPEGRDYYGTLRDKLKWGDNLC